KLKKDPQDTNISLETPLLPDNNEITLGSLMTSENLSYAQAIEVFLQFEHENEQAKNAEPEEHEELELPAAAKKPKAKAAPPKDPKKDEETPASKRKSQTPNEKPTSKKSKSATTEAPVEASTPDCEKPPCKKGNTSKAEAPAEASTACKKPAGKKSKSTEAEAPAEPSTTRKEKPTSKKSKSTPPPSEPTPTDPSEHPKTLNTRKQQLNPKPQPQLKLKAIEDLASAEAAADQDDAGDKQLDDGLDEMIKCIDEKDAAGDDGDAVDGEALEEPWSQDRQPDDPAMLKTGWSCLSLELGEKQIDSSNPPVDNASTIVNDNASVTELIELGASASQVSSNKDYGHLLAMVGQLQAQLQKQQAEKRQAAKPAEDLEGVALDEEQEAQADAEQILNAQSEVSAESDKKKAAGSKEAALQRLRSTHNDAAPATAAAASMHALPAPPPSAAPSSAAAPSDAPPSDASPPEVNSKTHKKEYMRLERAELLRRWVQSKENVQACECLIKATRRSSLQGQSLLPIHIEDRDAPGIVEETKYWVTTAETRTDTLDISQEHSMTVNATASPDDIYNIMNGPVAEEEPGVWHPGAEMKKEISTISGILLDLPDDDPLKEDLGNSQAKLTKLARKHLGSVTELKILKGKAKGLIAELKKKGRLTTQLDKRLAVAVCEGDIYGSNALAGFESRALRENEFHQRIRALGVAHQFDVSWKNIPVLKETPGEADFMAIEPWPVILPSTIASYQHYGVFHFHCVAYKGDMKYLVQSLNLQRHATREE
ncbi:unnamed protein product, partial [Symbiodinium necroappetens]